MASEVDLSSAELPERVTGRQVSATKVAGPSKPPLAPAKVKPGDLGSTFPNAYQARSGQYMLAELETWRDAAAETLEVWKGAADERSRIFPVLGFVTATCGLLLILAKKQDGTFESYLLFPALFIFVSSIVSALVALNGSGKRAAAAARLTAWLAAYDAEIKKLSP